MKPHPIDYASSPESQQRRKWPKWVGVTLLVVAGLLVVPSIGERQELGWIDAVSGSHKTQTVWKFGASSTPVFVVSPLEAQFRKLGLHWRPDWRNFKGTYVDTFGRNVGSGHGLAPEIYSLAQLKDLQEAFIAASTDDEIRAFFRIMSEGTEMEQRAAVKAAEDKGLVAMERGIKRPAPRKPTELAP